MPNMSNEGPHKNTGSLQGGQGERLTSGGQRKKGCSGPLGCVILLVVILVLIFWGLSALGFISSGPFKHCSMGQQTPGTVAVSYEETSSKSGTRSTRKRYRHGIC